MEKGEQNERTVGDFRLSVNYRKPQKSRTKIKFFNWVHSLPTELVYASHSTNLFANSCDHISTNDKAPLHPFSYKAQHPTMRTRKP